MLTGHCECPVNRSMQDMKHGFQTLAAAAPTNCSVFYVANLAQMDCICTLFFKKNFRWGYAPDPKVQINKTQVTKSLNTKKSDRRLKANELYETRYSCSYCPGRGSSGSSSARRPHCCSRSRPAKLEHRLVTKMVLLDLSHSFVNSSRNNS